MGDIYEIYRVKTCPRNHISCYPSIDEFNILYYIIQSKEPRQFQPVTLIYFSSYIYIPQNLRSNGRGDHTLAVMISNEVK